MFGISIVNTKKLNELYKNSAQIATENQDLNIKLESVKELAQWALKRFNYFKGTNRSPARKGEEYAIILCSLIKSLENISI